MPCYFPVRAWRARTVNPETGRRSITYRRAEAFTDLPVMMPCGGCLGCRLDKAQQWTVRCVHEAQLHTASSFITLTYSDKHLPPGGTLVKSDFQKFMKRLRKRFGKGISFFHSGEYSEGRRPHYHALLFGLDFPDRTYFKMSKDGVHKIYRSAELEKLWPLGYSTVAPFDVGTAAYVTQYALKKVTGAQAKAHYTVVDADGEIHELQPEYATMSNRCGQQPGGIGKRWYDRYGEEVYPDDFCVLDGRKVRVPSYYDKLKSRTDTAAIEEIKASRVERANTPKAKKERTGKRLYVRYAVKRAALEFKKRSLA